MSVREIQLGMQKYDKERDFLKPFDESDAMLAAYERGGINLPP